jgi:hypothetical protein
MLNPSPAELLAGVADALSSTVLPELPPGPAADQVQAAVGLLRRLARALPSLSGYLHRDIADLAHTLTDLTAGQDRADAGDGDGGHGLAELLAAAERLPPDASPLDDLIELDLGLRAVVAALVGGSGLSEEAEQAVVALLARLTEREAGLRLSPWER